MPNLRTILLFAILALPGCGEAISLGMVGAHVLAEGVGMAIQQPRR